MSNTLLNLNDFKYEDLSNKCYTCFMNDRKLIFYDRNTNIYQALANNIDNNIMPDVLYLCWECLAVLNRFIKYKQQVVSAFITLSCIKNKQECSLQPLSKLSRHVNSVVVCEPGNSDLIDSVVIGTVDGQQPKCEVFEEEDNWESDPDITVSSLLVKKCSQKTRKLGNGSKNPKRRAEEIVKTEECSDVEDSKPLIAVKKKQTKNSYSDKLISMVLTESEMQEARREERLRKTYLYRPHKCDPCIYSYMEVKDLMKHNERFHKPQAGRVQCDICTQHVNKRVFTAHRREHYLMYTCTLCGERMYKKNNYHFESRHNDAVHSCKSCGARFVSGRSLRHHVQKTHRGTFTCEYCGKIFNMKNTYKVHLLIHTDTTKRQCLVCNKLIRGKYYFNDHMKLSHPTVSNPNAYCAECDKQFKNIYTYRVHIKTAKQHVNDDTRFVCVDCDKEFTNKSTLKHHIQRVHLRKFQTKCSQCDKVLASKYDLLKHRASVHGGVQRSRDHVCNYCGKAFYCKQMLAQHIRQHTGERPYVCQLCNASFSYSGSFYTHKKLKHKEANGEKLATH